MVPKPKHFQNYEHETIDDYDINEKIREDNNTVLFVGRNLTSHKYVTIKAFHILKTHPKNVTDIVRKEFDTLKEIKHENLAPLLGFFCNAESVFIVTPFFPDGDMQKYIMESGGRSEAEAAEIFHQIVSAVAVLHRLRTHGHDDCVHAKACRESVCRVALRLRRSGVLGNGRSGGKFGRAAWFGSFARGVEARPDGIPYELRV